MRVRVLVAGRYNGPEHRHPVWAEPGDVIEVAGGWYAAELIARGLVSASLVETGEPATPEAGENQAGPGPTQKKPAEPKDKKLLDHLRKLDDERG